jgi:hypothetical protein
MRMTRSVFVKFSIMLALVVAGLAVIIAFPAEADKSQVEFESSLTVPAGEYGYEVAEIYVPAYSDSAWYVASFSVASGEVVRFCALDVARYELWLDGPYLPNWVGGSGGQCFMSVSGGEVGEFQSLYLIVLNDVVSVSQSVDLQVVRQWHESSRLGLFVGSVVFSLGIGLIPVLLYGVNRLHVEYSVLLSVMAWIVVFFVGLAPYTIFPLTWGTLVYSLVMTVPGVLFFEAFPLIVLLYLVEKHDGFAFFKGWNMKERLEVVSVFLLFGFCVPIVFMVFRMVSMMIMWPVDPDIYTGLSVTAGLLLMLVGAVVLAVLYVVRVRGRSVPAVAGSG